MRAIVVLTAVVIYLVIKNINVINKTKPVSTPATVIAPARTLDPPPVTPLSPSEVVAEQPSVEPVAEEERPSKRRRHHRKPIKDSEVLFPTPVPPPEPKPAAPCPEDPDHPGLRDVFCHQKKP